MGPSEETRLFGLTLGAPAGVGKKPGSQHTQQLQLRLAVMPSFPGARLALQSGIVCTGWEEAAKRGRRQGMLKREKMAISFKIPPLP